jgi:hypothetical protein
MTGPYNPRFGAVCGRPTEKEHAYIPVAPGLSVFFGAWSWVQGKAEIHRHITQLASISNTVMRPRTGDMEAKNSGATGTMDGRAQDGV